MTKSQWKALGCSDDVADALALSDQVLAQQVYGVYGEAGLRAMAEMTKAFEETFINGDPNKHAPTGIMSIFES